MLIIDGHNLLWSVPKEADGDEISDVQLCILIGRYLRLRRQKAQIIFDGIGPPDKAAFGGIPALEVIFSGRTKEADDVIEAKIAADSAPKRLKIVSSDRRIRKAARAAKAESVKSEQFYKEMIRFLSHTKSQTEPCEKRLGLDEAQTKQWLRFFDLEQ